MNRFFRTLQQNKDFAPLFIRIPVGLRLIYGTYDNIVSWGQMLEFRDFLANFGFPFPLGSAILSVYAQFICGLLFLVGYQIRWAAMVMIINFGVALIMVHTGDTFQVSFQAIIIMCCSFFLLFNGSGKVALSRE